MDEIKFKLKKITEAWNSFFWEYKFCNSKINFGIDGKKNYYADIFHYFNDTLVFLENVENHNDFYKSVFQATGIMQTIYVHQDLMDEILHIFKLQESELVDKNPNRTIRNELIGHPIRRDRKNQFVSSIFLGKGLSNGNINYVLYSKERDFFGISISYKLDDIISRHLQFLNKYLDLVLKKITIILTGFKTELFNFQKSLTDIPIEKIINITEHKFESILNSDINFNKIALNYFLSKKNDHPRYERVIQLFKTTLNEYLIETIDNIERLLIERSTEAKDDSPQTSVFEINIISVDNNRMLHDENVDYGYELSKLYDKHPIFNIEYFRKYLQEDSLIEELNNMETNYNCDLEYYCSYAYLRLLLKERNLLV